MRDETRTAGIVAARVTGRLNFLEGGDLAGGLDDAIALLQVAPPHVLVGDFDDVADGEPALLAVGQADALVPTCGSGELIRKFSRLDS